MTPTRPINRAAWLVLVALPVTATACKQESSSGAGRTTAVYAASASGVASVKVPPSAASRPTRSAPTASATQAAQMAPEECPTRSSRGWREVALFKGGKLEVPGEQGVRAIVPKWQPCRSAKLPGCTRLPAKSRDSGVAVAAHQGRPYVAVKRSCGHQADLYMVLGSEAEPALVLSETFGTFIRKIHLGDGEWAAHAGHVEGAETVGDARTYQGVIGGTLGSPKLQHYATWTPQRHRNIEQVTRGLLLVDTKHAGVLTAAELRNPNAKPRRPESGGHHPILREGGMFFLRQAGGIGFLDAKGEKTLLDETQAEWLAVGGALVAWGRGHLVQYADFDRTKHELGEARELDGQHRVAARPALGCGFARRRAALVYTDADKNVVLVRLDDGKTWKVPGNEPTESLHHVPRVVTCSEIVFENGIRIDRKKLEAGASPSAQPPAAAPSAAN